MKGNRRKDKYAHIKNALQDFCSDKAAMWSTQSAHDQLATRERTRQTLSYAESEQNEVAALHICIHIIIPLYSWQPLEFGLRDYWRFHFYL